MNFSSIVKGDGSVQFSKADFSKIISDYYRKNYGLNVVFDFLPLNYICNEERVVYDYKTIGNMTIYIPNIINSYLPCLIEKNSYEYYKMRNIAVPGVVKFETLDEEIKKILPKEIIMLSNSDIIDIFRYLGYSQPLYNWFYNAEANDVDYSAIVTKIENNEKNKVLEYQN